MAETTENEVMEFTEEDIYMAALQTRLRGMEAVLKRLFEDVSIEYMLGENGLPFIRFTYEEDSIDVSYLIAGDVDEDRYILVIRSTVYIPDEKDDGNILTCEAFNMGSPFGFAVYDPTDGSIELRAQIPEIGDVSETKVYDHIFDLFIYSMGELRENASEV